MTDENGNLSIDFLAGFTIFILAFIWVVSMIPGLMVGLQSYTIDYDAVAYRTGVILVEDPGWPVSPPWEYYIDQQKSNVTRFGLAISKDTPNILAEDKVNRFFCTTAFIYPDDYRSRVIFGDYPYGFNVSLIDLGGQNRTVGDVLPDGYGYIRRPVKIKGTSFATINNTDYITNSSWYIQPDNATTHVFSILIDNPKLLGNITDPAYQIDPAREQITIKITDLRSTITNYDPVINNTTSTVTLSNIRVYKQDGGLYSNVPLTASEYPYIDGSSTRISTMPYPNVADNITLRFNPQFFDRLKAQSSKIYIALGFTVSPESTFLNNTQALPDFNTLDGQLTFDNPNTTPFYYDYNPSNVTQPHLRDAVVEVAVWSGAVTSYGGGGTTPNGTHTIYASAGSGGTIFPIGSVSVSDGANQLFTIANNTHYHITDVVVDGVSNGTISSYTFNNVVEDHTIAALFAIDTFNINASAGVGGAITPNGNVSVNYGASQPFAITPDAGYNITDVFIDGVSNGTISSYTFSNVMANHTINASFAISTYVITPTTPLVDGAITPNTPQTVNYGDTPTFTFTPNPGYHLDTVLVDGNPLPPTTPTTYTFPAVTANYTIAGTFAINAYTITSSAGPNGAISPSGAVNANDGDTPTFNITPNVGYHIADVLVDGGSVGAVPTYTFASVHADHTISATFAANAPISLFSDDFEVDPSSNGWTVSGIDWYTGIPNNGGHSVQMLGSAGAGPDEYIYRTISTSNYSGITVSYSLGARSIDAGEYVAAQYSTDGGVSYTNLTTYVGVYAGTATLVTYSPPTLPASADHNAAFRLRFGIWGSGTGDYGWVDDVQVLGIPD